jgi:hypothetical protein
VRTPIWIAISVSLLVAILKPRLHLSLYALLQILGLTLFEKMPVAQALAQPPPSVESLDSQIQPC